MSKESIESLAEKNAILEKSLKMQNAALKLSEKEILNLEQIIEMYERHGDFYRQEMIAKDKINKAIDEALELSRQELIDKDRINKAIDETLELSRQELIDKDRIIEAVEKAMEYGDSESKKILKRIKVLEEENKKLRQEKENIS